jgi:hypothetical protein
MHAHLWARPRTGPSSAAIVTSGATAARCRTEDQARANDRAAPAYADRFARLRRSHAAQKCENLLSVSNTEFE